ncbi:MAG: gluconokinase [Phaeodactylibacter sp.]|nr:gluconokinase [Phaeodactylibacter sp.]MCB9274552.1 gluconokinase [Lewinellaceae bacterium]
MLYYLGIDIGTTSTKALAVTTEGKQLALARAGYPTLSPQDGYQEQAPEAVLIAVISVLKDIDEQTGVRPQAVGLSCAMHSLIVLDSKGQPLTNAMLWSDRRSQEQAQQLTASGVGKALYQATGTPIHPMSPLCKLRWLRERQAGLFAQAARFVSIKEYILQRLCGAWAVDYSIASATGLMDIIQLKWWEPALAYAGIAEGQLSPLASPTHLLALNNDALPARQQGTPVALGANDGCLANLGALALGPDEQVLTVGTSGAIRRTGRAPIVQAEAQIFNYRLDETYFVSGGATNNGGIAFEWLAGLLGRERLSEAAAAHVPAGSEGLLFLPYLLGERAPIWDANATSAFLGLRLRHGPAHLHRAVLEGVAFSLYHIAEQMPKQPGRLIANGGFTQSDLWLQLFADVFGTPVWVDEQAEASALGAAYVAMKATGAISSYESLYPLRRLLRQYLPDAANHEAYREVFRKFKASGPGSGR